VIRAAFPQETLWNRARTVELNRQLDDNGHQKEGEAERMNDEDRRQLAETLRVARAKKDLTAREVARRAGVDVGTVRLLERERIMQPRIDSVRAIAQVVGIPLADVYAILHWLPEELPSFRPYMRSKYSELPDEAVAEVEQYLARVAKRHGIGPIDGEDERADEQD
jgi:transcriptional regulator with XRE-family HTH domain